eukprot:1161269-Pelagomonas_calceolata.AAC.19
MATEFAVLLLGPKLLLGPCVLTTWTRVEGGQAAACRPLQTFKCKVATLYAILLSVGGVYYTEQTLNQTNNWELTTNVPSHLLTNSMPILSS